MQPASHSASSNFGKSLKKGKVSYRVDVNYSSVKCQSIEAHFAIGNLCSIVCTCTERRRVKMEQVEAPNDLQKLSSKLITPELASYFTLYSTIFFFME